MFCPKCGFKVPDGSDSCPACGANLSSLPNAAPSVPDAIPNPVPAAPEELPTQVVPEMAPTTVLPSDVPVNEVPSSIPYDDRTEVRPFVSPQPQQPTYAPPAQPGFVPTEQSPDAEFRSEPQFVPAPPQSAPAAPAGGGNKGGGIVKIIGIVVALAAVIGGAVFALNSCDKGGGSDTPPATSQPADTPETPADDYSAYFDGNDNLMGSALIELDGATITELLPDHGYEWSSSSDCWLRQSDMAAVAAYDGDLELLSKNEIAELKAGGQGEEIVYVTSVGGYSNIKQAFDGALGMDIEDVAYEDTFVIGRVSDSRGNEYIVYSEGLDDGTFNLYFFNEKAIKSGAAATVLGADLGETAAEVWANALLVINGGGSSGGGNSGGGNSGGGNSGGGNSGGGSSASNAVIVDDNHNITAAACCEMSGSDIANEMANWGYSWSDGSTCWLRGSDLAALGAMDSNGNLLGKNDMLGLKPGAEGTAAVLINSVGGYSNVQDAFRGGVGYSDVDYIDAGDTIFCKLESSTGHTYVCVVMDHGDGTFDFVIFNDACIAAGIFEDIMGVNLGSSASEVWTNIQSAV